MKMADSITAAIFLTAAVFAAAAPAGGSPGPEISFAETVHDAGEVWEGEVVSHTFVFTNAGNEELEITGIRTTCGCTAGILSEEKIAPGETGKLRATFNTRGYRGRRSMPVFVSSNDPRNPVYRLRLEATVQNPATFTPRNLNFGAVPHGKSAAGELNLVFDDRETSILGISTHPAFFQARIVGRDESGTGDEAAEPIRFEVALSEEAPVGRHRGSLTVRIDHPEVSEVFARLHAVVEGPLNFSPPVVFFSEEEQRRETVKGVRLVNRGDRPVTILNVESDLPQFRAEARVLREGEEFEISVTSSPGTDPARRAGEIIIRTDHPLQSSVRVPLRSAGER